MPELERRNTAMVVEIREGSEKRTIGGYASVFNRYSDNLGGFIEQVAPGFFAKSQGDGWPSVVARYNHSDDFLLGTSAAGTLRLSTDERGLTYDVDLPSTRADVHELVQRGDVRQSSFAFQAYEDDWSTTEDGYPLRTLVTGRLVDVAPVNTPAYQDATVGLRSLAERFDADPAEIRSLAEQGELTRLFKRTDRTPKRAADPEPNKTLSSVAALTYLAGRRQ